MTDEQREVLQNIKDTVLDLCSKHTYRFDEPREVSFGIVCRTVIEIDIGGDTNAENGKDKYEQTKTG